MIDSQFHPEQESNVTICISDSQPIYIKPNG